MNRSKKGKNRKLFKKKSHSNNRLGCIIAIIVLIPILFGVYLYCQQINTQNNNEPQTDVSLQIPLGKDLETPVSLVPRQEQIIRHSGYTVSYNKDLKIPNWVSYELTRKETKGKEKRGNRFIADPLVTGPIATNADYTRSGYDKGHMAPAADMKWSPEAMKESFYFSNMCPQHPQLNRRGWKNLEEKIRDWAIADSAIIPPLNINSGEIENWGVETNIGYHINSHWNVNANYSWLHMENPVLAAPEHKLYAGADYTSGRWSISTGVQYVKGLYTSVVKGSEQQDHFVLWNLRGNYRVCRFANLFIKGENLLAQRYEINAGYPMPKATFMGGINLNF